MATTATALSDQQLEAELRQLQTDSATVRKKLDEETRKLEAARADRQRIVDGIARGSVKESEAPRIKVEIETIEIRIEGLNSLHAEKRSSMNTLQSELGRREAAAAREAREKEFAELKEKAAEKGNKILGLLTKLCAEDLPAFEAGRQRLAMSFADLGGGDEAIMLGRLLVNPSGPMEALRSPEVHLAQLEARGWTRPGSIVPRANWKPGLDSLSLTVLGMRPKE